MENQEESKIKDYGLQTALKGQAIFFSAINNAFFKDNKINGEKENE